MFLSLPISKVTRQAVGAVVAALRAHIQHVLRAVDLLLDGCGDDSETTLALAPGNAAFTVTWGGPPAGIARSAGRAPPARRDRIMISAITVESTGRSMKK